MRGLDELATLVRRYIRVGAVAYRYGGVTLSHRQRGEPRLMRPGARENHACYNPACYNSCVTFDAVDRRILEILREQGRASHALIAKEVGLSAPAVGERIRKLEHAGVIAGYEATFRPEALGLGICAFVAIAPQPRNPGANLVENLRAMPEIEELHAVAGPYGYIAKVRVGTPEELDAFLDRLWVLEGVERTETTMVLRTSVERPMYLPFAREKP